MTIEFSMVQTIGFAVLLLFFGRFLRRRVSLFERFAIPSPVIGGFLFAIVNLIFHLTQSVNFQFDTTLQSFFMILFFTSIGFGASPMILRQAGPKVALFLLVTIGLVIAQNLVVVGLAPFLDLPAPLALMVGSTSMTGGHGTSAGIAPLIQEAGFQGAESIAYTAATFGLVAGSLLGGPVALRLIRRHDLVNVHDNATFDDSFLHEKVHPLNAERVLTGFMALLVAMFIGSYVTDGLNMLVSGWTSMAQFPAYLGPMICGILARWYSDFRFARAGGEDNGVQELVPHQEIDMLGTVTLSVFLAMALMSVRLWELGSLAFALVVLLAAQVILTVLYTRFITFKAMGSTYDAAVLVAGNIGFAMGATPNGMANMESVTAKFGPSPTAFFVLPVVGGMFIDFFNIMAIIGFLAIF
ncbi:sodium/glutamate symporter [Arcanobacterium buesumense]|uniref:Sodium/glutamate symporter n=1 Tax=Arcanobacterium buesumense TaxID=2722751 RepID=A0A6H2EHM7_9ACTO|nr:sodium/glutamate symporter [Arcanobacterium buesumense]QJC21065.1 sodium/glutamate symporter [Arcanobacterium buesumense]